MVFSHIWLFWILVPLWVILSTIWLLFRLFESRGKLQRSAALAYSNIAKFNYIKSTWRYKLSFYIKTLRLLTLLVLMLAMARPQSVLGIRPASTLGIDIILTVDTSGSMKALDLDSDRPIYNRRTRLQVVKDVVAQFIKKRNQDQIGLVVFGVEAFLQCPLTLDHHILTVLLDRMQNGMAGEATAIGSGIGAAVNRLKKSKAKSRVMVLLTDGINNAGPLSPMLAAEIAKTFDVKIYTIGVGTRGEAPFIVEQPFFGKSIVYDEVSIDEDALREVANITGGEYFRAENTKSLENIYKQIDKLEKSQSDTPAIIDYDEHAPVFIGIALAMLIFEILILGTWLRRLP